MSETERYHFLDGPDVDLEREDVRDSQGRRVDEDYVERAVADVHARRGRPPLTEDTPAGEGSPRVSFRLPEPVRVRAEQRAALEGRTVSELAREALERYLAG